MITGACAIGVFGAVMTVPIVFSDGALVIGGWYGPYLAGSAIASTVCMIGLWKMRRWGLYLYAGVVATNQVVMLSMDLWHIKMLLVPAVFAVIVLSQWGKLR